MLAAVMSRRIVLQQPSPPLPVGLEWSQINDTYQRLTVQTAPAAIGLDWNKTTDVYTVLSR